MSNSTRNKLTKNYTLVNDNKNEIEKLSKEIFINNPNVIIKKFDEIILLNKIHYTSQINIKYTFNNIAEEDLLYLYPYTIFETSEGFQLPELVYYFVSYKWEKISNNSIALHIYLIVSPYQPIPIYVTTKIQIYNPKLFKFVSQKANVI